MNIEWSPEAIEDQNSLRAFSAQDKPVRSTSLRPSRIAEHRIVQLVCTVFDFLN